MLTQQAHPLEGVFRPTGTATQRVLVFGSSHKAYPDHGVRLAFGLLQATFPEAFGQTRPVVVVHRAHKYGVDDHAETVTKPWRGWTTEPHPVDWKRCSRLCEGAGPHRQWDRSRGEYCPNADSWAAQELVNAHREGQPYALCLVLPYRAWGGDVLDAYNRAIKAHITTMALGPDGQFFTEPKSLRKARI